MNFTQKSYWLNGYYSPLIGKTFPGRALLRYVDHRLDGVEWYNPSYQAQIGKWWNEQQSFTSPILHMVLMLDDNRFNEYFYDPEQGARIFSDISSIVTYDYEDQDFPYNKYIYDKLSLGTWDSLVIDSSIPVFDNIDNMKAFVKDIIDNDHYDVTGHGGLNGYDSSEDPEPEGPDDKEEISDEDLVKYTGISDSPLFALAKVNNTTLTNIKTLLEGGWLKGDVGKSIISLKMIKTPSAVSAGESEPIINPTVGSAVYGNILTKQYNEFNFGTYSLVSYFGNFLDYDPYTSVHIYLPYSGVYQLKANDIMNGSIGVKCIIDMLTGNLVYYITVNTPERESSELGGTKQTIYQFNGNCAFDQAISAEDYGNKVSGLISAGMSVIGGIMSNNPFATSAGVASGIETAMSQTPAQCGDIGANNGFSGIQYPYLIIRRPRITVPQNYNHIIGRPSMKQATLSNLTGFTKMYDLDLNNITGATESELTEIEALLKSGVIL